MRSIYIFIGIMMMFFSCKASKSIATQAEIDFLNSLVNKQAFTIKSDRAYPQVTNALQQVLNSGLMQPGSSSSVISLIGNYNFLTISKDSVSSFLPYFGERQMQVAYNGGDSAIQFDGVFEDYKAVQNKDHSYTISFQAKSKLENFQVFIKLFPNLKTHITVNGNSRFPISYSGDLELIDKNTVK
ncbi:DUF4251 domain-containing protein [Flavivirga rizhaonensis]|uniref:DUF4251 domain-containing protein n=1 Tax=Flavivirga rizhaonensis TaxID=2559571 RepID=A0A4S1DUL8_9FLAO|nr:DUF4251 domain-containing protein [Flavivirga rizhaonensis]TGV01553.1 DUF4251 domain-containing protein [Flavivirga rizhaonensis]